MNRTILLALFIVAAVVLGVTDTVDGAVIWPALAGAIGLGLPSPINNGDQS